MKEKKRASNLPSKNKELLSSKRKRRIICANVLIHHYFLTRFIFICFFFYLFNIEHVMMKVIFLESKLLIFFRAMHAKILSIDKIRRHVND